MSRPSNRVVNIEVKGLEFESIVMRLLNFCLFVNENKITEIKSVNKLIFRRKNLHGFMAGQQAT